MKKITKKTTPSMIRKSGNYKKHLRELTDLNGDGQLDDAVGYGSDISNNFNGICQADFKNIPEKDV